MPPIERLLAASRGAAGEPSLAWEPGRITVIFTNGRRQGIRYREAGGDWVFETTVTVPSRVERLGVERVAEQVLQRNRETDLVAFGFGRNYRLDAWITHRASTLQSEELRHLLLHLAYEADRFELLLTGTDRH